MPSDGDRDPLLLRPARAHVIRTLRSAGCVFAEDEADLLLAVEQSPAQLRAMIAERESGTPLEQILGWAEFAGLHILLEPGVFVPRRRTEFLAECASERVSGSSVVLDLCCGSGAVGAAILSAHPGVVLYASDIDPAAVACARRNIVPASQVMLGDLFDPLPVELRGHLDLIVANAPYVPTDALGMMPPEARLFEARIALDGGGDGLDIHRRIAAEAGRWLSPGGHLLIETSAVQAASAVDIFTSVGLRAERLYSPDREATVVIGKRQS